MPLLLYSAMHPAVLACISTRMSVVNVWESSWRHPWMTLHICELHQCLCCAHQQYGMAWRTLSLDKTCGMQPGGQQAWSLPKQPQQQRHISGACATVLR